MWPLCDEGTALKQKLDETRLQLGIPVSDAHVMQMFDPNAATQPLSD